MARLLKLMCMMVLGVGLGAVVLAQSPATDQPGADTGTGAADGAAVAGQPGDEQPVPGAGESDQSAESEPAVTRTDEMLKLLVAAGWIGLVLLLVSMAGLAFALERLVNLRRGVIVPVGLTTTALKLLKENNTYQLIKRCRAQPSTLGRIITTLLDHRDCSADVARTLASDVGGVDLKLHQQRNHPLAVVGTLAPLLGLLGTVFGMIRAFQDVAAMGSMGNAQVLATGIYQALVTTAMGLVIAVPALALYHFFKTRTSRMTILLEESVTELIRQWFVRRSTSAATTGSDAPAGRPDAEPSEGTSSKEAAHV